ncbi:ROK family transcriptional regulator [uncultured Tessaracoccus sp.]|uniref:ROK family transcriptional regulator n=1 Tax=uncultured Tessaracoccus sp. TaxID=905023 RepID=UPI0025E49CD8|nr:ROK family transcriptional regulator [uncultured Tessaracoccus sp.]
MTTSGARGTDILALDRTSRRVLEVVLRQGPMSRVDVAAATGLSSASLTRLTKPLVRAGFLEEGEPEPAAMGRPSLPLAIVDDAARFLGAKIVPGEIHAVVTGLAGRVRDTLVVPADTATPEDAAQAVADVAARLGRSHDLAGIGVALAGAVDPFGTVRRATLLGWPECNLSRLVSDRTGLRCSSANDVDALALSQHWTGVGRGTENFVTLTIGAGVGAGAVVGNQLLVGHQGYNGMVGHLPTRDGGTFHDRLSTDGLRAAAGDALGRPVPAAALPGLAPEIGPVLDAAARSLAELVLLAKHVWGPERILLTGEGIWLLSAGKEAFGEVLAAQRWDDITPPDVVVRSLQFLDWATGAAALAIRLGILA